MSHPPVIEKINTRKRVVALTFNIANGSRVPIRMLSLLRQLGITQATFFLTGMWVRAHPAIARRIRRMGYEIASHGHQHQNYTEHSNKWIEKEVYAARKAIHKATGVWTQMLRTPSGDLDARVVRKLLRLKQTIVHWDTDSLDWKYKHIPTIVSRVVPKAHPGAIILLHACDPWTQSLTALPLIVNGLKHKGYNFVTVSQLLTEAEPGLSRYRKG
ncbi:polysaccharide deacetylase family protein [Paenibacillus eucommiae]|uniref:Peptidoglycan/xylan/chitin deacetylase (PgdA/CDA1 family) n=1 Tax=Paenibacillus eucommiae TaxID=1355755 RepID=A0ABS4INS3_9BACL|nr:polysaccharide deacetylase family protein [Paenibacillus eucommiae]MBP1989180.1 peptidoglycan/xylan/chitin deacetylase (PgdA/CDA1 family) [Paenibacillus eucommiae]